MSTMDLRSRGGLIYSLRVSKKIECVVVSTLGAAMYLVVNSHLLYLNSHRWTDVLQGSLYLHSLMLPSGGFTRWLASENVFSGCADYHTPPVIAHMACGDFRLAQACTRWCPLSTRSGTRWNSVSSFSPSGRTFWNNTCVPPMVKQNLLNGGR